MVRGHIIKEIKPGSIAQELELESGDQVIAVNDKKIDDVFDYQYLIDDEYIELTVLKKNGEEWVLEIEKDMDDDMGIVFETSLMDEYHSCTNNCIFCFIDQLPKGMRETLYFKDDDSRLSFLQGNYITLTNMKDSDLKRIIQYHLAPINISVHTTNPELRCMMLHNRFAGKILDQIDSLYKAGIPMNAQIVLCKGINDGEELRRTIRDLGKYQPFMESLSVVPVGLSDHRDGLYPLGLFTKEDACEVLDIITFFQEEFMEEYDSHFVHASDEWYILAERPIPDEDNYDGYIQLENGVGMIRLQENEFMAAWRTHRCKMDSRNPRQGICTVATGLLAAPFIQNLADRFNCIYPDVEIRIQPIINHFFGPHITVSGLLTGRDIISQLEGKVLGSSLLLPINVLRSGEDVLLDDITIDEIERTLQVPVRIVKSNGDDLFDAFLECAYKK